MGWPCLPGKSLEPHQIEYTESYKYGGASYSLLSSHQRHHLSTPALTRSRSSKAVPYLAIADSSIGQNFAYSPPSYNITTKSLDDDARIFTRPRTILTLLSAATASLGQILPIKPPYNHSQYLIFLGQLCDVLKRTCQLQPTLIDCSMKRWPFPLVQSRKLIMCTMILFLHSMPLGG